jgi:hypothetical protein
MPKPLALAHVLHLEHRRSQPPLRRMLRRVGRLIARLRAR